MFFFSFRNIFSDNTRVRIFILFVAQIAIFFPQNITLGYMTKTLNQIIFLFPPPKSEYFFSNIGNQNIFLEKNHSYYRYVSQCICSMLSKDISFVDEATR